MRQMSSQCGSLKVTAGGNGGGGGGALPVSAPVLVGILVLVGVAMALR